MIPPYSDTLLVLQLFSWRFRNPPLFVQAGIGTASLSLATITSVAASHQLHLLGIAYSHHNQAGALYGGGVCPSPLKSNKVQGSSRPYCNFWDEGGWKVFGELTRQMDHV